MAELVAIAGGTIRLFASLSTRGYRLRAQFELEELRFERWENTWGTPEALLREIPWLEALRDSIPESEYRKVERICRDMDYCRASVQKCLRSNFFAEHGRPEKSSLASSIWGALGVYGDCEELVKAMNALNTRLEVILDHRKPPQRMESPLQTGTTRLGPHTISSIPSVPIHSIQICSELPRTSGVYIEGDNRSINAARDGSPDPRDPITMATPDLVTNAGAPIGSVTIQRLHSRVVLSLELPVIFFKDENAVIAESLENTARKLAVWGCGLLINEGLEARTQMDELLLNEGATAMMRKHVLGALGDMAVLTERLIACIPEDPSHRPSRMDLIILLGEQELVEELSDEPEFLHSLCVNTTADRIRIIEYCVNQLQGLVDSLMDILPCIAHLRHARFLKMEEERKHLG